jgi:transposase-like protein
MEKTVKKKNRRFSREFKIAAVRRVLAGEPLGKVARELELNFDVLWTWKKRVVEQGEHCLYEVGRRRGAYQKQPSSRVEELRQGKNDDGEAASSK